MTNVKTDIIKGARHHETQQVTENDTQTETTTENATSAPEKPVEPSTVSAYTATALHETGAG